MSQKGFLLCQRIGEDPKMEVDFEAQGAKKHQCNRCKHPVWISSRSIQRIKEQGVEPVCNQCMPNVAKEIGKDKTVVLELTQEHHVKAMEEVLNDLSEGHRRRN